MIKAFQPFKPLLQFKFILVFIGLALLPGNNYYYQLDLSQFKPLVRPVNYQFLPASQYPVNLNQVPAPYLTARGVIVIDADTKTIIFSQNPDLRLLPASTTKIMTALVVLDHYALNEIITIGNIQTEPVNMDLKPGERITVENLLYGLLVGSANDAAIALAQAYPQGQPGFVVAMNQKAKSLHLFKTQFTNPIGLDDYGQYTTVHDLSLLTAAALDNPIFKKTVATIGLTVTDVDKTQTHELTNINQLLGQVPGLAGVKTGYTQLAGECLITYTQRQGHSIITVVLASTDRFNDTLKLINWVFTNFRWQTLPPAIRS